MKHILTLALLLLLSVSAFAADDYIEIVTDAAQGFSEFVNPLQIVSLSIREDGDFIVRLSVIGNTFSKGFATKAEAEAYMGYVKDQIGASKFP